MENYRNIKISKKTACKGRESNFIRSIVWNGCTFSQWEDNRICKKKTNRFQSFCLKIEEKEMWNDKSSDFTLHGRQYHYLHPYLLRAAFRQTLDSKRELPVSEDIIVWQIQFVRSRRRESWTMQFANWDASAPDPPRSLPLYCIYVYI